MYLKFPKSPDKLTPAEENLLEFIEGNREEFLFMTIGQLAEQMGTSEATISRFARHMGCLDFKQLKTVVIEQNHLEGPAGKLAGTLLLKDSFQAACYLKQQQLYLEKTAGRLPCGLFMKVFSLLFLLFCRDVLQKYKSAWQLHKVPG